MNYLFYDYETSGRNEVYDQILQFGAIKTDSEFNQIGEPIEFFCKLRRDVLPSPGAIKVNQIDVDELNSIGLTEFEFAKEVSATLLGNGNQCVVGYNSKGFDDKFTRFLLYRNFHNPYAWFWKNGNSSFDIYDVMSLGYSFDRLADIKIGDEGETSLRLENLSLWNDLDHEDAHNAVSDVKATIQLAKLVKKKSPKLFEYALSLRTYNTANQLINTCQRFFHSSSLNGYPNRFLSLHAPICRHPFIQKSAIGWNLKYDPTEILHLSAGEIRNQKYSKKDTKRIEIGFDEFKLNQSPMIVKYYEAGKERIVDAGECDRNFDIVNANIDSLWKLAQAVFDTAVPEVDPDTDLYVSDFLPQADVHDSVFSDVISDPLAVGELQFRHTPFLRLFRRMKARNFFDKLEEVQQSQYLKYCSEKFACTDEAKWITKAKFDEEMTEALADIDLSQRQKHCLTVLQQYVANT